MLPAQRSKSSSRNTRGLTGNALGASAAPATADGGSSAVLEHLPQAAVPGCSRCRARLCLSAQGPCRGPSAEGARTAFKLTVGTSTDYCVAAPWRPHWNAASWERAGVAIFARFPLGAHVPQPLSAAPARQSGKRPRKKHAWTCNPGFWLNVLL